MLLLLACSLLSGLGGIVVVRVILVRGIRQLALVGPRSGSHVTMRIRAMHDTSVLRSVTTHNATRGCQPVLAGVHVAQRTTLTRVAGIEPVAQRIRTVPRALPHTKTGARTSSSSAPAAAGRAGASAASPSEGKRSPLPKLVAQKAQLVRQRGMLSRVSI